MQGLEKAIRNALEKGGAEDEAFRQRVYQSAFAALERALKDKPDLSPEAIEARRARLRSRISLIESEFVPAVPELEPQLRGDDRLASAYDDNQDEEEERPRRPGSPRRRRKGRLAMVLLAAGLVFAVMILGTWWSLQTGLFLSPQADDNGAAETAARPGAQRAAAEQKAVEDWIAIFDPDEPDAVAVPSGSVAEIAEEDGLAFLRLKAQRGAAIRFDVGQGTLERLAGRTALFSMVARAAEPTQMSVTCDFGGLGDCGRKRYEVSPALGEFLFEVQIPARSPSAAGTILIQPDIEGSGIAVDLREIRVAITG